MNDGEKARHMRVTIEIAPERLAALLDFLGPLAMEGSAIFAVDAMHGMVPIYEEAKETAIEQDAPVLIPERLYKLADTEGVTWIKVEHEGSSTEKVPIFTSNDWFNLTHEYEHHLASPMFNSLITACTGRRGFDERYLYTDQKNRTVHGLRADKLPELVELFKNDGTTDKTLNRAQLKILDRIITQMYIDEGSEPKLLEFKQEKHPA